MESRLTSKCTAARRKMLLALGGVHFDSKGAASAGKTWSKHRTGRRRGTSAHKELGGEGGPSSVVNQPLLSPDPRFLTLKQECQLEDLLAPFVPCCSTTYFVFPSQPGPGFCGQRWGKMHRPCRLGKATAKPMILGPSKAVNES